MNKFCNLLVLWFCWTIRSFAFVAVAPRKNIKFQSSNVALEEHKEELKSKLPSIDHRPTMSKLEVEFRELLEGILYTPNETKTVTNTRLRAIYEGVAASYYEPAVYRAFEVLYEDYTPLRVAGRMVYRKLQSVMENSKLYQQEQIETVVHTTGLPWETVESCWSPFVELAEDRGMSIDKIEQIIQRGIGNELFESDKATSTLLSELNPDRKESLAFAELMSGLHQSIHAPKNPPAKELQDLFQVVEQSSNNELSKLDKKRQKYNQRYDDMLENFGEWKQIIPSGEGRRLDILRGCFVGSENQKVVEALRVIYTDYYGLRLSGDWIFQVVSTLMNATTRKRRAKNQS